MTQRRERPGESGLLVVVATPIGNLGDLAPRALQALREADVICCEDTRRTRALLSAFDVPARGRLVSLHAHNERERAPSILREIEAGRLVALVSDAGTPGISDPGSALVSSVVEAGLAVSVIPGPSAVTAALVVSGLPTERFSVEGFLPRRGPERRRRLDSVASDPRTTVVLEAPARVGATLADLAAACGADRRLALVRELTKVHEEVWRGTAGAAADRFADLPIRGEVVIVLEGCGDRGKHHVEEEEVRAAVAERLATGAGVRAAAGEVAERLGIPRRRAYETALTLRREGEDHADRVPGA